MSQEKENACKSKIRTLKSWLCSELLHFSLFVHEEPLAHSAVFPLGEILRSNLVQQLLRY